MNTEVAIQLLVSIPNFRAPCQKSNCFNISQKPILIVKAPHSTCLKQDLASIDTVVCMGSSLNSCVFFLYSKNQKGFYKGAVLFLGPKADPNLEN